MKITHCISSIDSSTGGPARSVTHIIEAMLVENNMMEVSLLTKISEQPIIKQLNNKNGIIKFHESSFLGFSKSFKKELNHIETHIFHGHGLWLPTVHQMAKEAREQNIPYIITPRGMLEPWALQQSKIKKQIVLNLFQYNDLAKATCLHATAPMEVESIRKLGLKNPVAMIPNGIVLQDYPFKSFRKKEIKTILFLSRIHPKKGIEILIEAWEKLDNSNKEGWQIQIAGNGEQAYINKLNKLIKVKRLQNQIKIIGPQFGEDKIRAYHNADLFVLPTYSENFGIVIAEALACGVPVITTKGTPWKELNTHNAGWWIDIGLVPLIEVLNQAMQLSEMERQQMGKNGHYLIKENYSIESAASKMVKLYTWILKGGEKPAFVLD